MSLLLDAPPRTTPSTRRLSEVARHVVIPSGIVTTGWHEVEARAHEFGDEFDEWQRGLGQLILGKRADGIYAATVGGVVLSIPRQVAKTFIVGRLVFILCTLHPGLKVVWTAHRTRTSTQTFKTLQTYAKRSAVAPYMLDDRTNGIRKTNGEQEIEFANKSIIMFGAREGGFGRGFDEVDIEVFDEAQILTEKALEDMVAATNQSRHPHGALLFYMGTPPRPVDPGEAFTQRRDEALSFRPDGVAFGEPAVGEDTIYVECSADADADPDDREQWAKANASFPHRTPVRSMLRLRKNLPSVESWRREALGIWDEEVQSSVMDMAAWAARENRDSRIVSNRSWGFAMSNDRRWATLGVAGKTVEGLLHVEWVEHRSMLVTFDADGKPKSGQEWWLDFLAAGYEANKSPIRILSAANSKAASFIDLLRERGVKVDEVPVAEGARATGLVIDGVNGETLAHIGQPSLTKAVRHAGLSSSGAWVQTGDVEISPLVAVTVAAGGVTREAERPLVPLLAMT